MQAPYPKLGAGVEKYRRMAHEGLMTLDKFYRRQYGEAVEKSIRALQRSELQRVLTPLPAREPFGDALRQRHRAALLACPAQIRRKRTPGEWQELYDQAMKERQTQSTS